MYSLDLPAHRDLRTALDLDVLSGLYSTSDGRYLSLVMLQPGKFWGDVCQHIGRPELADDPRFATGELLAANAEEASQILQEVIGARPLAEWAERLAGTATSSSHRAE